MVGKRFGHWKPQNRQEQGRSRAKKTNAVRRRNKGTSHIIAHIAQDFGLFVSPPENAKRELDEVGKKTGDRLQRELASAVRGRHKITRETSARGAK
jgi:hypothetical protein